jgi:hypothetical protein
LKLLARVDGAALDVCSDAWFAPFPVILTVPVVLRVVAVTVVAALRPPLPIATKPVLLRVGRVSVLPPEKTLLSTSSVPLLLKLSCGTDVMVADSKSTLPVLVNLPLAASPPPYRV